MNLRYYKWPARVAGENLLTVLVYRISGLRRIEK